jgi:predicted  nucleic acid-binding Zn-ribbon protein
MYTPEERNALQTHEQAVIKATTARERLQAELDKTTGERVQLEAQLAEVERKISELKNSP